LKVRYRASRAVISMNCIEFSKKPIYSEKSALLKFGVFQQNRPEAVYHYFIGRQTAPERKAAVKQRCISLFRKTADGQEQTFYCPLICKLCSHIAKVYRIHPLMQNLLYVQLALAVTYAQFANWV
jgi:hypothetical protein